MSTMYKKNNKLVWRPKQQHISHLESAPYDVTNKLLSLLRVETYFVLSCCSRRLRELTRTYHKNKTENKNNPPFCIFTVFENKVPFLYRVLLSAARDNYPNLRGWADKDNTFVRKAFSLGSLAGLSFAQLALMSFDTFLSLEASTLVLTSRGAVNTTRSPNVSYVVISASNCNDVEFVKRVLTPFCWASGVKVDFLYYCMNNGNVTMLQWLVSDDGKELMGTVPEIIDNGPFELLFHAENGIRVTPHTPEVLAILWGAGFVMTPTLLVENFWNSNEIMSYLVESGYLTRSIQASCLTDVPLYYISPESPERKIPYEEFECRYREVIYQMHIQAIDNNNIESVKRLDFMGLPVTHSDIIYVLMNKCGEGLSFLQYYLLDAREPIEWTADFEEYLESLDSSTLKEWVTSKLPRL